MWWHVQSIPVLCGDTALFQIYLSQIFFLWIGDITFCFFFIKLITLFNLKWWNWLLITKSQQLKKNVMYISQKQFCMEKYQRVSSYYGNLLTYISYCFIKIKILIWIARSKNLQLVGEKWPNLPNKFIYLGMTYRYSVMGIIGLRHEVSIFTSLIAHHRRCLSAGRRFQQPCCIICFKFLILRESMIYYQIART